MKATSRTFLICALLLLSLAMSGCRTQDTKHPPTEVAVVQALEIPPRPAALQNPTPEPGSYLNALLNFFSDKPSPQTPTSKN
ncbi:o-spanin [Stenotrophomonas phage Marzo]|nr:o-spanin [Stenotrophomonas phage Marzo]